MSNIQHLDPLSFTMQSVNPNIAPTSRITPPSDPTVASAWSSSPLGDPATGDEYIGDRAELPLDPITPAAKRLPLGKNAVVIAAVLASFGAGAAALTFAVAGHFGSPEPKPAVVVPDSAVVPGAPSGPAAAPAAPVAPAAPPAVSQPENGQPAFSPGGEGSSNGGAAPAEVPAPPAAAPPPADPGTPPANGPGGPSVSVGPDGVAVGVPNGPSVQVGPIWPPSPPGGWQGQPGNGQGQQGQGQQGQGQQGSGQQGQGQQGSGQQGQGQQGQGQKGGGQKGGQQDGGKNGPVKVCIPCQQHVNTGHL
jgi:hypothetical protein